MIMPIYKIDSKNKNIPQKSIEMTKNFEVFNDRLLDTLQKALATLNVNHIIENASFQFNHHTEFLLKQIVTGQFIEPYSIVLEIHHTICGANKVRINLLSPTNEILTFRISKVNHTQLGNALNELIVIASSFSQSTQSS